MMIKTTLINIIEELESCEADNWARYPDEEVMNIILAYLKNILEAECTK